MRKTSLALLIALIAGAATAAAVPSVSNEGSGYAQVANLADKQGDAGYVAGMQDADHFKRPTALKAVTGDEWTEAQVAILADANDDTGYVYR
jgi:hypothetical protein